MNERSESAGAAKNNGYRGKRACVCVSEGISIDIYIVRAREREREVRSDRCGGRLLRQNESVYKRTNEVR